MQLSIKFNDYDFAARGRAQFSRQVRWERDTEGAAVRRATVTYGVQQIFREGSFAENQLRYAEMMRAVQSGAEGRLVITDEFGNELVDVRATPQESSLPEQWGQYQTEVTISFVATEKLSAGVDAKCANVPLKNVTSWRESIRIERPTLQVNNRRETVGTVTATGRFDANPQSDEATRRVELEQYRDKLRLLDRKDALLVFGGFSQTVRVETVDADMKDGSSTLEWSIAVTYRRFPSDTYAEAEYDVTGREDRERSERITAVRGKVRADSVAAAKDRAAEVIAIYKTGVRTLRTSEIGENLISGGDGDANFAEVAFSAEYRESTAVVNWTLGIAARRDTKSGQVTTTYSGRVTGGDTGSALGQARTLGFGKPGLILGATETVNSAKTADDPTQFVAVDFSYEYATKGDWTYAEMTSDKARAISAGVETTSISGNVTAATLESALSVARSYKPASGQERSSHESHQEVDGPGGQMFVRVDFGYEYAAKGDWLYATVSTQVDRQISSGEVVTSVSGSVTAIDAEAAAAKALSFKPVAGIERSSKTTTENVEGPGGALFVKVDFSYEVVTKGDWEYSEVNQASDRQISAGDVPTVASGSVTAPTLQEAQVLARSFKPTSGIERSSRETSQTITGPGGAMFVKLDFSYEAVVKGSWTRAEVSIETDRRITAGEIGMSISGSVVAPDSATALIAARGYKSAAPGMERGSRETSQMVTGPAISGGATSMFVKLDFSYEFVTKGEWVYADVQSETNRQTFGQSTKVVGGSVTAATVAAALEAARAFKPADGLLLSSKESDQQVTGPGGGLFMKVDFSYTIGIAAAVGSIEYGRQVVKDYESREKTTTVSGTAYGPDLSAANGLINGVVSSTTGSKKLRDERTENLQSAASKGLLVSVSFSVTFSSVLGADDGGDAILEADFSLATTYSVNHAVITPIPFGYAHVQTSCGWTVGVKVASGSVTATTAAAAKAWARGKRSLAIGGGHEDPPEERESPVYARLSGETAKSHRFQFTYSARFPNLAIGG